MIMRKRRLSFIMSCLSYVERRDIFDAMFSVKHSVEEIVIQQGCYQIFFMLPTAVFSNKKIVFLI